jgi:hypothetical protein
MSLFYLRLVNEKYLFHDLNIRVSVGYDVRISFPISTSQGLIKTCMCLEI